MNIYKINSLNNKHKAQSVPISKDIWNSAIAELSESAPTMAQVLTQIVPGHMVQEAVEKYLSSVQLAILAMQYVAENARDKVRVVPVDDAEYDAILSEATQVKK